MSYSYSYSTGGGGGSAGESAIERFVRENDARVATAERDRREAQTRAQNEKIWKSQEYGHTAAAENSERNGDWRSAATSWNGAKTNAYRLGAYDRQAQYEQREQIAKQRAGMVPGGGARLLPISSGFVGRTLAQRQQAIATADQQQQSGGGGAGLGTYAIGAAVLTGVGYAVWKFVL